MAKVIYGAGVSQMSGKQGGTVFSRNKSGAYTRTNRKGTNPNTQSQQNRRASFRAASRYFKTLSSVQQQSFKDNAINYPQIDRLGQTVTLSGAQLANKFANLRLLQGGTIEPQEMGSPVFVPTVNWDGIGSSVVSSNIATLTITGYFDLEDGTQEAVVPANFTLLVKATKLMGNGFTAPKKKDFRVIVQVPPGGELDAYPILTPYSNVFGSSVVGGDDKIFISLEMVSLLTPQSSAPVIANKSLLA
jgi:hypothetical protein